MVISSSRHIRIAVALSALLAGGGTLSADVIVPSAAYTPGGNGADFRTDVRVYNPTGQDVLLTPIFYRQANAGAGITASTVAEGSFTVPARGQVAFDNIISGLFGQPYGSFGPIRFQSPAPVVISSATNNYNGCGNGSVSGQWIPGLDLSRAAQAGELVQLGTSTDPGSGYRTNVVFFYPGDQTASVTATLRRGDGSFLASAILKLDPNGFKQFNNFKDFAPAVSTTDTNLWLEYTSDQPVLAYASVINNASGDPFAVVAVPPPAAAPLANLSYQPLGPLAGDSVNFSAASPNSPQNYTWNWGDGTSSTGGPTNSHTYAAKGTFRVILTVTNDAGGSTVATDVVVTPNDTPPGPKY